MNWKKSMLLRLGERLLNRRWWFVALASLSVLSFELLEYMPFARGVKGSFFFEVLFYGIFLPISTGLALSGLAASRSELAWSTYYQNLIRNLDLQLYNAHSHDELATVFLQFVRVVVPLVGATLYRYDQRTRSYKTILNWSLSKDSSFFDSSFGCTADCPLLAANGGEDRMAVQPC
ncbi:MAG TPA: hypothetical protein VI387_14165, partial [Candidatus Brocadiales bacterium]|nr:hypothetical protein [Candidatus Brocadiales bacterium]